MPDGIAPDAPERSFCPVCDPEVVTGGIENPEVLQAPRTVLEILAERPSGRYHPVAFTGDIVNFKYQFRSCRRQPRHMDAACKCPSGRPDADTAAHQRYIRARIAALILHDGEAEHPCIEVNGGVQVVRKDLKPQRHLHHRMLAHPSSSAAEGRLALSSPRERPLISVSRFASGFWLVPGLSCVPAWRVAGFVPAARDRVVEAAGGAARDERRDHRGGLMPRRACPGRGLAAPLAGSGGRWCAWPPGAAGCGDRIRGLAGGDDGVQLPQDRRGGDGLRLGGRGLVVLPADQVLVTGGGRPG